MASTAYWYADKPYPAVKVPPVGKRLAVLRDPTGKWHNPKEAQITSRIIKPNKEMRDMKARWKKAHPKKK